MQKFTAALFRAAKMWTQAGCPSSDAETNVVHAQWAVSLSLKRERRCPARMNLKDSTTQKTTYHLTPSSQKPPESSPERAKVEKRLGWRGWGACSRDTGFPFSDGSTVDTECHQIKCFKTVYFMLHEFQLKFF